MENQGRLHAANGKLIVKKTGIVDFLYFLFLFFCMTPHLSLIPGLDSDMQPNAVIVGALLILLNLKSTGNVLNKLTSLHILLFVVVVATFVLIFSQWEGASLRGYYNHVAPLVIVLATCIVAQKRGYAERQMKAIIWLWLLVSLVQMLFDRSFMSVLISNARYEQLGSGVRGTIGLASEPSFYGIACFYFMNLASRFKKSRIFYLVLLTVMGLFLAQSAMGAVFIAAFWVVFLLDMLDLQKGLIIIAGSVVAIIIVYWIMRTYIPDSRIFILLDEFINEGFAGLYESDKSTATRTNSIVNAIRDAFNNYLLPQGYGERIGSGFGGLLNELGIFALAEIGVISAGIASICKTMRAKVVYLILIIILLFSNTNIGNPQLLMVVGYNLYYTKSEKKK